MVWLGMMGLAKEDEKEEELWRLKEPAKVDETELKAAHPNSSRCPLELHSLSYSAAKAGWVE